MDKIIIEVLGSDPPCPKCKAILKNAEEAAKELGSNVIVRKVNILSPEAEKYEVVMSPAVVINGKVVFAGKVVTKQEIINAVKEVLK